MSDSTGSAHKIKQAHEDVVDFEEILPVHRVFSESKLLDASVEVIDLTEDAFVHEFKCFLNTLDDRRQDVDARRAGTKAKGKNAKRTLCVPGLFLPNVRIHQDSFICELFRMKFINTMVYGTLTAETIKDNVTIYQLDDGTAQIDVYYRPSNNKMLEYLNKLSYCEETLRNKPSPLNEESVPACAELRSHLMLLISLAKAQCQKHLGPLKLRTKCFAVGRPFIGFGGKMCVSARLMLPDTEIGNSCELFWKSYLLSVYEPLLEKVNTG
uniref:Uncharacterized protein n=1 Tax=Anopheles funestus TaxID=62324 RepID=A0A4Y0BFA7_ANOFN